MRRALHLVFLPALCACIELDEFPQESIITGPRVIAVVTDPPEVTIALGTPLSVRVLVAEAEDVSVEYSACPAFDSPFGGSQFGERDDEDCAGDAILSGSGESWELTQVRLAEFLGNREIPSEVLGGNLDPDTIQQVVLQVGWPLLIEATIDADGRELRAVKRVLLSVNPTPHTNPPRPRFEFGGTMVNPDPEDPWGCVGDQPLVVRTGSDTEISPFTVDGTEDWVEKYKILNARGELEERTERAFYSWFATAGDFDRHTTRAPLRNQIWTAPNEPGQYRLWLVVRDGHGGASACGVDIRVRR
jgi:hypothetical protein